jgi:HEAT repeat protein
MMFQIVAEASRLRKTPARRRSHFIFSSVASLNLWLKISTVTMFVVATLCLVPLTEASPAKSQVERLIAAARIYDEQEMQAAIDAIVTIGSPAIPELRPALKDFDDNVRWQAIIAFGRIGAPARGEVHRIVQALGDDDSDVRAAAAEALGMLKVDSSNVIQTLKKHLKDEHGIVRASANWALWELQKDQQSIPRLTKEFASSDWMVTDRAVRHLASIGKPADQVLAKYLEQKEHKGRQHAAAALAAMYSFSQSIIPVLINHLSDDDPQVARFTAKALGNSGEGSIPGIIKVLKSNSSKGKLPAIQALGYIGENASLALPILLHQLSSDEQPHRLAILHAIGSIGVNQHHAEEKVRSFLIDPDPDLRGAACQTLAQLKVTSTKSISQLQQLAETDPKDFVRQAAKNALLSLGQVTATSFNE